MKFENNKFEQRIGNLMPVKYLMKYLLIDNSIEFLVEFIELHYKTHRIK